MNGEPDSLDRLNDLVAPPPLPWWPPAPAWYVVIALLLLGIAFAAWKAWRRWRANAYRRAALAGLERADGALEIAALLRRTALAIAPRAEVAALSSSAWPDWLDRRGPEAMPAEVRAVLARALYAPAPAPDPAALRAYARRWISHHR